MGRDEEISLLLRRWRQARDGAGQVVLLSGEPGIGKSRIVRELRDRVVKEAHVRLLYQCSPHHTTRPLHPVIEQLERAAGFARDDPPEVRLDNLEALVARCTDQLDPAVPLLAALLGLPTESRYPALDLTPQRQKQRTLEVLVNQLDGLAAAQPVLVVYEDAHWIDPTTQELLGLAIERIQRLPVLLLITFRPESTPPWAGQPHVSALNLTRLGRRDGALMVGRVVREKTLPAEVSAQIVAKTDGVPLFVEELTKTVLESGLLKDAGDRYELSGPLPPLAIPSTLHDSLLARLDHLASVKEVAQIGAAIGREFSYELVAAIADQLEPKLHNALDLLVTSELVFRRGAPPDATYTFKHALVRDVAYGTLLKSRRRHLHARIVKALEERLPQTVEAQPAFLAYHCTEAALIEKAIEYSLKAGQVAIARSAHSEAVAVVKRGLQLVNESCGGASSLGWELDLQLALGRALLIARGEAAPETGSAYKRALELCKQMGETQQLFLALYGQCIFHFTRGELASAHRLALEFYERTRHRANNAAQSTGTRIVGVTSLYLGRPADSRYHLEEELSLVPVLGSSGDFIYPYDLRVLCLTYLSAALFILGYPEQALLRVQQSLAEARVLAHPESVAFAMAEVAALYQDLHDTKAVQELAEALITLADEQDLPHFMQEGLLLQSWALAQHGGGRCDEAIARIRQAIAVIRAAGKGIDIPYRLLLLAGSYAKAEQAAAGLNTISEALDLAQRTGECWLSAELHRAKGELLLVMSEPKQAEAVACFQRAMQIAREQQAKLWELRAAISLARLWGERGRRAEAHDLLEPIYRWFTEGFDTADLKEAKALLDELA